MAHKVLNYRRLGECKASLLIDGIKLHYRNEKNVMQAEMCAHYITAR